MRLGIIRVLGYLFVSNESLDVVISFQSMNGAEIVKETKSILLRFITARVLLQIKVLQVLQVSNAVNALHRIRRFRRYCNIFKI